MATPPTPGSCALNCIALSRESTNSTYRNMQLHNHTLFGRFITTSESREGVKPGRQHDAVYDGSPWWHEDCLTSWGCQEGRSPASLMTLWQPDLSFPRTILWKTPLI